MDRAGATGATAPLRCRSVTPSVPLLIDARTLRELLDGPSLRVFDATVSLVRPEGGGPYSVESGRPAYERAHIPGAGFADLVRELADPRSPFPFALPSSARFAAAAGRLGIGPGTHVVAYAQQEPMWATRLWWLLRHFGFDDVSVLDGGLPAWKAAGAPLSDEPAGYEPVSFVARPRSDDLALRADVEAILAGEQSACLVNALSPSVFRGEGPSSYSRPGRIPGSVNAPWSELVDPATNRFRSPAELEAAFERADVEPTSQVVAYCGGGISATVDVFALALLEREGTRLYDGSLTEWSADPQLPLELG
jgi:thiosulfate/3-mercaptopyruvate sulfurtransferase